MTVRFAKQADPRRLPEYTLWRMCKNGRFIEARTRLVPFIDRPEFRVLISRADGTVDLLWSEVLFDSRDIGEMAKAEQRRFEVQGWSLEPVAPLEFARPH